MASNITTLTVIDINGQPSTVTVASLPSNDPLKIEVTKLNQAAGLHLNGALIKKEN